MIIIIKLKVYRQQIIQLHQWWIWNKYNKDCLSWGIVKLGKEYWLLMHMEYEYKREIENIRYRI